MIGPSCQQIETVSKNLLNFIVQKQIIPDSVRLGEFQLILLNQMSANIFSLVFNFIAWRLFLRLGFHSCVGGCNGCLNLDDRMNVGLKSGLKTLDMFYVENNLAGMDISRADFWAMAAVLAVEAAYQNAGR